MGPLSEGNIHYFFGQKDHGFMEHFDCMTANRFFSSGTFEVLALEASDLLGT